MACSFLMNICNVRTINPLKVKEIPMNITELVKFINMNVSTMTLCLVDLLLSYSYHINNVTSTRYVALNHYPKKAGIKRGVSFLAFFIDLIKLSETDSELRYHLIPFDTWLFQTCHAILICFPISLTTK
jgi:hypothetical protein